HGLHLQHLELLPRLAEGALPGEVAAYLLISAVPDGAGHRPHAHQHARRDGSALRRAELLQADAEIPRPEKRRALAGTKISPPLGLGAVARDRGGLLLRLHRLLRLGEPE